MSALDLAAAKTHLNITASTYDAELQLVIDAAEAAIVKRVGPLQPSSQTARVSGGSALVLPVTPAISLTSITPVGGSALSLADVYLNTEAGVVSNIYGASFCAYAYDVAYLAGREECPDDLLFAVKELVRHLWSPQRGGAQRPGSQPSDALANTIPGAAYAFPFRVEQLIAPHERIGFA